MSASQSRVHVSRLAASGVGAAYVDDQRVEVAAQEDERRRRRELDARGDARHLNGGQTSSLDELLDRRSWPQQDGWPPVMASPRQLAAGHGLTKTVGRRSWPHQGSWPRSWPHQDGHCAHAAPHVSLHLREPRHRPRVVGDVGARLERRHEVRPVLLSRHGRRHERVSRSYYGSKAPVCWSTCLALAWPTRE